MEKVINIDNVEIPIIIRNIKRAKSIKMFVRENKLVVTKPYYASKFKVEKLILENREKILDMYLKSRKVDFTDCTQKDIQIMYKGKITNLKVERDNINRPKINFFENEIIIILPNFLDVEKQKELINNILYKSFKRRLDLILKEKLEYYSKLLNVNYTGFTIRKMTTKYGSCNTKSKKLNFNINLLYMPDNVCNMIVVHELCHLVHNNHSKEFYNLLKAYIKDYDMCKMWLKNNSKYL